jgi:hypothetical protein
MLSAVSGLLFTGGDSKLTETVLQSEILLTLRLLGVNKLSELRPSMVEVKS